MRNTAYCYVFHRQRARLRPESVLVSFISCKGNHKHEAFFQIPAMRTPMAPPIQNEDVFCLSVPCSKQQYMQHSGDSQATAPLVLGICHYKEYLFPSMAPSSGTCPSSFKWWVDAQPCFKETAEPTATSQQSNNFCLLKLFFPCLFPASILLSHPAQAWSDLQHFGLRKEEKGNLTMQPHSGTLNPFISIMNFLRRSFPASRLTTAVPALRFLPDGVSPLGKYHLPLFHAFLF